MHSMGKTFELNLAVNIVTTRFYGINNIKGEQKCKQDVGGKT